MATLFFLAKLVASKNQAFLYGALVCLGLAFLTMEYAPLLLVVVLATLVVNRSAFFGSWKRAEIFRFALKCAAIPLMTVALLWPAAVYKLTIVKDYLWYGYESTLGSADYGSEPLLKVWMIRFLASPFEYALFATGCVVVVFFIRKRIRPEWLPFLLYSCLMLLTTARNRSLAPEYVSSLIPALDVMAAFAVWAVFQRSRRFRGAFAAATVVVLAGNSFWFYYRIARQRPPAGSVDATLSRVIYYPDENRPTILELLRENQVRRERLLVPQEYLSTIHFYFPETDLGGYSRDRRFTGEQIADQLSERLSTGRFDGMLCEGADCAEISKVLEERWVVRAFSQPERQRRGNAVVYYRLAPLRPASDVAAADPTSSSGALANPKTVLGCRIEAKQSAKKCDPEVSAKRPA